MKKYVSRQNISSSQISHLFFYDSSLSYSCLFCFIVVVWKHACPKMPYCALVLPHCLIISIGPTSMPVTVKLLKTFVNKQLSITPWTEIICFREKRRHTGCASYPQALFTSCRRSNYPSHERQEIFNFRSG